MKLSSTRTLERLKPVLKNSEIDRPSEVYWVFSDLTKDKWANLTIITPDKLGDEYPKTFGHYHGTNVSETYHLVEGEGVMQLQKKFMDRDKWVPEKVSEVVLVKLKPGDELTMTPEWGHSLSNIGELPLLTFDNWRAGHSPTDYSEIERLSGMAYFLVSENDEIKVIPNSNYQDLPTPVWMTASEFKEKYS